MNIKLKTYLDTNYPEVTILIASKYLQKPDDFRPFLDAGIMHFGENRAQSLQEKQAWFKDEAITWHFIGPLQSKKVKKIINDIDVFHALDRVKIAQEIQQRRDGVLPCYIEVNISGELQKHGLDPDNVEAFMKKIKDFNHLKVIGLMGMASHSDDHARIRQQFQVLVDLRDQLQQDYPECKGLSMGMTNDYEIALEMGTTVLRLGRIMITEEVYES